MYFHLCCNSFEVYEMTVYHMSQFLAQGLHLKSHINIKISTHGNY